MMERSGQKSALGTLKPHYETDMDLATRDGKTKKRTLLCEPRTSHFFHDFSRELEKQKICRVDKQRVNLVTGKKADDEKVDLLGNLLT